MTADCIKQHQLQSPCGPAAASHVAVAERCSEHVRALHPATLRAALRRFATGLSAVLVEPISKGVRERRDRVSRQQLLELDDRLLDDIGLTREDVRSLTGTDPRRQQKNIGGGIGLEWLHDIHLDR